MLHIQPEKDDHDFENCWIFKSNPMVHLDERCVYLLHGYLFGTKQYKIHLPPACPFVHVILFAIGRPPAPATGATFDHGVLDNEQSLDAALKSKPTHPFVMQHFFEHSVRDETLECPMNFTFCSLPPWQLKPHETEKYGIHFVCLQCIGAGVNFPRDVLLKCHDF